MIYTVSLAKGGAGKSTVSAELASALAARGRRVLLLDLDEQGNASTRAGVRRSPALRTAADVLLGRHSIEAAVTPGPTIPGVDVLPGSVELREAARERPELTRTLRTILQGADRWDDVVIDTPPALDVLTIAALTAADRIVVPVTPEVEALEQASRLDGAIRDEVAPVRADAKITAVIPFGFTRRVLLDQRIFDTLYERFGAERVMHPIRYTVTGRESFAARQPISRYAPDSAVARDFALALEPIIDEGETA